jgi:nitroimidazol reductase NimA-like FMN-containing flavoprotein (pyridoxamine 5'-phosphate oxidase superfamily)
VDDLGKRANVTQEQDLAAIARSIVDANRFMALGTADASGTPWVSPVWYAPLSCREYVWVSRPQTRHSRNLAARPQVAIAIYDSHRAGGWSALYMAAVAEELEDVDVALEAFNRRSEAQGLRAWWRAEVVPRASSGSTAPRPASSSFSTTTTGGFRFICSSSRVDVSPTRSPQEREERHAGAASGFHHLVGRLRGRGRLARVLGAPGPRVSRLARRPARTRLHGPDGGRTPTG